MAGNKPDDADLGKYDPNAPLPRQFRNPVHCVERANDGLVYVCDRQADRIQVFNPDGTFVKEAQFAKNTLGSGSTWDLAFSRDPEQKYLYIADGTNEVVRVVVRETLQEITAFGDDGRQPGQFSRPKEIAADAEGNLYVVDTAFGNFQIFNPDGELLLFIGTRNERDGPARFMLPSGITVDEDGRVYVVDEWFRKIDIFRPYAMKPGDGYLGRGAAARRG